MPPSEQWQEPQQKNYEGERVGLRVEITVLEGMIISIELNTTKWDLRGVKLGERRSNVNDIGMPIHTIRNTGNIPVVVDMGYGPQIDVWPSIQIEEVSLFPRFQHPG